MLLSVLVGLPFLSLIAKYSNAQMPDFLTFGYCWEDSSYKSDFHRSKLSGTWYTVKMVNNKYIPFKSCMRSIFHEQDGYVIRHDDGIDKNDEPFEKDITLSLVPEHPNVFILPRQALRPEVHIWVLDGDYDSFACMYSCAQMLGLRAEFGGIISRTPYIHPEVEKRCKAALDEIDESLYGNLVPLRHDEECPYWEDWKTELAKNLTLEADFKRNANLNTSSHFTNLEGSQEYGGNSGLPSLACYVALFAIIVLCVVAVTCLIKKRKVIYTSVKTTQKV